MQEGLETEAETPLTEVARAGCIHCRACRAEGCKGYYVPLKKKVGRRGMRISDINPA